MDPMKEKERKPDSPREFVTVQEAILGNNEVAISYTNGESVIIPLTPAGEAFQLPRRTKSKAEE